MWNALHKMGWARKKTTGYKERSPRQRRRFLRRRARYVQRGLQPIHIDECGFAPSVIRRDGYAPKGQRVDGLTSGHRRPRSSLIAACDTEVFNSWLKTRLCRRLTHKHLVIMDNAAFHTSSETVQLIEETGATLLFLPPYSPTSTPIEHDFAALKKPENTMKLLLWTRS